VSEIPTFGIIFKNLANDRGWLFVNLALATNGFAKLVERVNQIVP
tara:strand:- start:199 stop:333 length:135 start_codon:yes stop_codon:yes gene_type:complete